MKKNSDYYDCNIFSFWIFVLYYIVPFGHSMSEQNSIPHMLNLSAVFNKLSSWSALFEELAISLKDFSIFIQMIPNCSDIYLFILWNNTHFPSMSVPALSLRYQPRAKASPSSHCVSLRCSLPVTPSRLKLPFSDAFN